MTDRVRIETRRSALAEKVQREVQETVVLRDQEVVAVLPEGDPMAYTLSLSADELLELREKLHPILKSRPKLRSLLEALIEYQRPARNGRRRDNHERGPNGS